MRHFAMACLGYLAAVGGFFAVMVFSGRDAWTFTEVMCIFCGAMELGAGITGMWLVAHYRAEMVVAYAALQTVCERAQLALERVTAATAEPAAPAEQAPHAETPPVTIRAGQVWRNGDTPIMRVTDVISESPGVRVVRWDGNHGTGYETLHEVFLGWVSPDGTWCKLIEEPTTKPQA